MRNIDTLHRSTFSTPGPVRLGLRKFLNEGVRPPTVDPTTVNRDDPRVNIEEVASRVLLNRHQLIIDFLRRQPRYVLCIGTAVETGRHRLLAQNFIEEAADRKLTPGIRGVLQIGAFHAAAVSDDGQTTTRMILETHGYKCISIRAISDFVPEGGTPDDVVVSTDTPLDNITQGDLIRLTSLVDKTPVTIPTDKQIAGNQASPFRRVTFGLSQKSVAEQFEYIVLQKV